MKHFIKDGQVYAFEEDGSQDNLIADDMSPISNEELEKLRAPTLEQAKSRKLAELKAAADAEVAPILAEYPEVEIKTWDSQEREARAWAADSTSPTPTLYGIAQTRGKSISYLAPKVIQKADDYRQLASNVSGKRQGLADAVEAATTVAEVEAIIWQD